MKVAVVGSARRHRRVLERLVEPLRALARLAGLALARRLIVARALPGPGRQVAGGGEHRHVGADLGEDVLRGAGLDPVDGAQQLNRWSERAQLLLDRL